jgi:hypothetical protein
MRVEDRELVAVVLEEPDLRIDLELEAVGRGCGITAAYVSVRDSVAHHQDPARLVGAFLCGMVL